MNKEEYKQSLKRSYPDEPDGVLELAWYLHNMEKAKQYISQLMTCNTYMDVATKVIRPMYTSCDIDSVLALKESFLSVLLPFTAMDKAWNAHSATYHIRKMLDNDLVKAERRATEARQRQAYLERQQAEITPRSFTANIQILLQTDDENLIRQILNLAEQCRF